MKIFAGGKELRFIPISQNGVGRFYGKSRSGPYAKFTIDKFDKAKPPAGYNTYNKGSHAFSYVNGKTPPLQLAYDFPMVPKKITLDVDVRVIATSSLRGSYTGVAYKDFILWFVHVDQGKPVGSVIRAGQTIAITMARYGHLHFYVTKSRKQYDVKKIILSGSAVKIFKKGDWVKFTVSTRIRKGNGLKYSITGKAKAGSKYQIEGGPRRADNHDWYDLKGADWCVSDWMVKTTPPAPKPVPPAPAPINWQKIAMEHEKQYNLLLKEIKDGKYILAEDVAKKYILKTDLVNSYIAKATVKKDYVERRAFDVVVEGREVMEKKLKKEIKVAQKERRQTILKKCGVHELIFAILARIKLDKILKQKVDK